MGINILGFIHRLNMTVDGNIVDLANVIFALAVLMIVMTPITSFLNKHFNKFSKFIKHLKG